MKRFHVNLTVADLAKSIDFYTTLYAVEQKTFEQPAAECCYAKSTKTWVRDPDEVAWETFVTHGQITHYGTDKVPENVEEAGERCCA